MGASVGSTTSRSVDGGGALSPDAVGQGQYLTVKTNFILEQISNSLGDDWGFNTTEH